MRRGLGGLWRGVGEGLVRERGRGGVEDERGSGRLWGGVDEGRKVG